MHFQFKKVANSDHGLHLHQTIDVSGIVQDRKDVTAISPLIVDLTATSSVQDIVQVQGKLSADVDMICSRCLKPVKEHISIDFHEQFKQSDKAEELQEDEDEDINFVDEDIVDLRPYIEEYVLFHIPFAPVCEESCKGLCPSCGTNLNEHTCGCSTERIDPRLAGLKDFFNK
ncbi:DUF177 domain-containing protein [Paenibacillus sediminis]|uniref:DUF177 domain-containing protein n=1 Tax=Paenibacillus sediminis TaxID=664909 RepID=A0ABS4H1R1_9BACL|nr:DUF177 domain-containing protein [Paenibacillus sediminis]MBP1936467.1 uncharacterized protein [Paenibacillus sediminis]